MALASHSVLEQQNPAMSDEPRYCHKCKAWHSPDDSGWKGKCQSSLAAMPGSASEVDAIRREHAAIAASYEPQRDTTTSRIAPPSPYKLIRTVGDWNDKHKPGKLVEVTLDDGSIKETYTTSVAWVWGGHTAVVMLNGIVGCYNLNRVRPRTDNTVPYQPANM